jgi:oxalate decarboxylase/phosphoglucose isomerase-like protein (cupin superfamily)
MNNRKEIAMTHSFTVAGAEPVDLDVIANQLRQEIDALPPGSPPDKLLKASQLNQETGVGEFLVVVRGNEDPHIHPEGDLIVYVLEGEGYFQLSSARVDATEGSVILIPKGVCHAYYNLSETDSVLLATFSPINSKAECPPFSRKGIAS